jgi:hypothetical protein
VPRRPVAGVEYATVRFICLTLSQWLVLGLLVIHQVFAENDLMATHPVSVHVSFCGSKTSRSGFKAVTDINYDSFQNKDWPYLSVAIRSQDDQQTYWSKTYAAWFEVRLCWDDADRLWIDSADTGIEVIASTPDGWRRHCWMPDSSTKTIIDAESGERLAVVDWRPPIEIDRRGDK